MHPLLILVVWKFLNFGRPEVGKKLEINFFLNTLKSRYFSTGNAGTLKQRQKDQMVSLARIWAEFIHFDCIFENLGEI